MRIDEAKTWIGAVVLLIIMAAIGVLVIQELYDTIRTGSTTVTNQTLTSLTSATPYQLVTGSDDWPADLSVTHVTNASDGVYYIQNATNWYVNSTQGQIVFLDAMRSESAGDTGDGETVSTTDFNVTFSYEAGETKTDTLKNATLGISNLTKQIPTVGIIVGVLLIVGAVMLIARYFGRQYTA